MTATELPKLLMLEPDPDVSELAGRVFARAGWKVVRAASLDDAREQLRSAGHTPFALVVSGAFTDARACIDLLAAVASSSPLTQRMLWLPPDQPELLIEAVNTASIHACLTYPFGEAELKAQVKECLERFHRDLEQARFRKMVARHNKKMFLLAKNLKKKGRTDRLLLDEKKAERYRLEYELRRRLREAEDQSGLSLEKLASALSVEDEPDLLSGLFGEVVEQIRGAIQRISRTCRIDWQPEGVGQILHRETHGDTRHPKVTEELITHACQLVLDTPQDPVPPALVNMHLDIEDHEDKACEDTVAYYYDLIVEENGVRAWVTRRRPAAGAGITVGDILEFMTEREINYGRVDSETIARWLAGEDEGEGELLVAQARMPVPGTDGCVTYHFPTRHEHPGTVREDGSIDFRDRGEVPYVESGALLAEKQAPKPGEMGVNVLGEEIYTEEPLDPAFVAGHGTNLSEDGLSIYATDDGQPHVDTLGTITVNPEFVVKGDVDFTTGN
ncbi:MAG TPA: hypothetical protein DHV36_15135, partial [Desulfobacteraceae bacterium]|nr:hypothetical protein [Desulfobacteraceae bacterium]